MKRIVLLAACVGLLVGMGGCMSTGTGNVGPAGVGTGMLVSNVTYPNSINPNMEYRLDIERKDIEFLGQVSCEAMSHQVLLLFAFGDSGYGKLVRQAQAELGADGVMNITIDTAYKNILGIYGEVKTKLTGQAYRYKPE